MLSNILLILVGGAVGHFIATLSSRRVERDMARHAVKREAYLQKQIDSWQAVLLDYAKNRTSHVAWVRSMHAMARAYLDATRPMIAKATESAYDTATCAGNDLSDHLDHLESVDPTLKLTEPGDQVEVMIKDFNAHASETSVREPAVNEVTEVFRSSSTDVFGITPDMLCGICSTPLEPGQLVTGVFSGPKSTYYHDACYAIDHPDPWKDGSYDADVMDERPAPNQV